MARDYSNQRGKTAGQAKSSGNRKKPQPKKRGNTPKKNTRKTTRTPGWVWLGSGLFIGLTIAAVAFIATRPTGHPGRDFSTIEVPQPQQPQQATTSNKAQTTAQTKSDKPEFSFYKMLPDYNVVVPGEKTQASSNANDSGSSGDSGSTSTASSHTQPAPTTSYNSGPYVIQVGAFSTSEDANQLKARVTLLGLHANVVRAQQASGDVIYRVRSDVIDSSNRLTEMLKRLHDHDIETLVLEHNG